MLNLTLFKREMKSSIKTLLIFAAILTLYIPIIVSMYNPDTASMLEEFAKAMPEIMAAVGMTGTASSLTGFLSSYLYGMLLLVFPMVFTILRANGLIARYVDRGSMVSLVAAPVKRITVAFTQMMVLISGIIMLLLYCTILEITFSAMYFPGELETSALLGLNLGLLFLQLFIGGICFLASCIFNDAKYSIGVGAGIPTLMYILQMLSNTGGNAENAKYATFFTLFNPDGILAGKTSSIAGVIILLVGAAALFVTSICAFSKKDLHI